jgi:hypothetical protein
MLPSKVHVSASLLDLKKIFNDSRSPDPVLNGTAALKIRYNVERTEIGSGLAGRVYKYDRFIL